LRKFPIPALAFLYASDEDDREIFGDLYNPAGPFNHGEDVKIVTLPKAHEDGQDVEIFECRCPAQFYTIRAAATPDRQFEHLGLCRGNPAVTISTGSGMAELAMRIARALSEGMLGIRLTE
jgi:hypothetical protein